MAVRSLMFSHDSELIEQFTAALRVLGIQNEPALELDRAVRRLADRFDAVLVDVCEDGAYDLMRQVRESPPTSRAIVFAIGVVGVLIRRNLIVVLMSIELMLNAVNLTFIAFARH